MTDTSAARPLRIALVASYDVTDMHAWSGTAYYVLQTLNKCGFEVETIGALDDVFSFWDGLRFRYRKLRRVHYFRWLEPVILRHYGRQIAARISDKNVDVVVCLGSAPISHLHIRQPIVFMSDATFAGLKNFYPDFSGLIPQTLRNGDDMEQRALSRCALAIFASDWAARSALDNYTVDAAKIRVIPFGANIACDRVAGDIEEITLRKSFDCCQLLFVGVDWERKGGDRALEVAAELNRRGTPTQLHVVGCEPPGATPDFVIRHGFISKKSAEGAEHYDRLLMESHFLVIPSMAECYGLAFAEASSFGLPSLAPGVGGIPTVIRDGRNGFTLGPSAPAADYCDIIARFLADRPAYEALARTCFEEYTERLNWDAAGKQIRAAIESVCAISPPHADR